jgi:hypothetical protein
MIPRLFLIVIISQTWNLDAQPAIYWEPEIIVANGSSYGNTRPRIALTAGNNPIVIWGKGSTSELFTARWNGSAFDIPVGILPLNVESYLSSWTGPDIDAKGDTVVVVFKAMPLEGGHILTVRSTDGGITWSDTIRADSHNNGGVVWLPSLAMDENANPSVIYMAHDPAWSLPRYVVSHSSDQGMTFQNEMNIATNIPEEACDCCPAEYVIQGNQHALLFRNNESNIRDIFAVYSNDDGVSYSSFENVDQLNWNITSCPSTGPDGIFNNGNLLSVYASRASGSYRVYVSETATNPTLNYSSSTMMSPPTNANGVQNYPRIDGQNDTIVMVWQESETSNYEIFASFTTTGNVNELLNSKNMVNVLTTGAQTNPDILYADGQIHVLYQDSPTGSVVYRRGTISALGLNEDELSEGSFYPNPTLTGTFVLDTPSATFELYDLYGNLVPYDRLDLSDKTIIRVASKGIFYLHLKKESETKVMKVISL